jgi:hypothetical protein
MASGKTNFFDRFVKFAVCCGKTNRSACGYARARARFAGTAKLQDD